MIASHHDIENIPGFMDWFAAGDPPSRVEPVAVAHVEGIGCAFSRPLTEEERADILAFLRAHADKHREPKLFARLSAPLAEITGDSWVKTSASTTS
jgi:hypothetical protein